MSGYCCRSKTSSLPFLGRMAHCLKCCINALPSVGTPNEKAVHSVATGEQGAFLCLSIPAQLPGALRLGQLTDSAGKMLLQGSILSS